MTELATALEGLYATFARYPLRPVIPFCDHCHNAGEVELLRRAPLRELPPRDLGHVAFDLATTFGEVPDYKHLLPRVLELVAAVDPDPGFAPWLQAGKLTYTNWRTWPKPEQAAVEAFWRALFRQRLAQPWQQGVFDHRPEAVLAAMARADLDISAELAHWDADTSPSATLWLAAAIAGVGQGGELPLDWAELPTAAAQFKVFLLGAEKPLRLQQAFHQATNADQRQVLSDAEQLAWSLTAKPP